MWPEGLSQRRIAVTSSEMTPSTFRLVAQCLKQLHHRVPFVPKFVQIIFYLSLKLRDHDFRQSDYDSIEVTGINSEHLNVRALLGYDSASRSLCQQTFQAFRVKLLIQKRVY
jgi:hypothetical protein